MKARLSPIAVAGTLAGILLFVFTVQAAGPREVLDGIRRIGLAFPAVLALSALRMAVRAKAWSLCVEDPGQFGFRRAFIAFVTGDAVGNVTPLGPIASEGTKAILSRRNLATSEAFSSVVLENIFYSISVAVMLGIGTLALLLGFRPTDAVLAVTIGIAAIALLAIGLVWWLLQSQPRLLSRFLKHDTVAAAEERVFRFASARRERVGPILLLEFAFHAAAVAEIYLLLALLVGHSERTLLLALVLEAVERAVTIAFKFVPLRLGVDQAGSGWMANFLGLGAQTGVTIATVRTARNLLWAAVGLTLLLGRSVGKEKGATDAAPQIPADD
jgi:Lysylphosphatidylglycerol synthase TM region